MQYCHVKQLTEVFLSDGGKIAGGSWVMEKSAISFEKICFDYEECGCALH